MLWRRSVPGRRFNSFAAWGCWNCTEGRQQSDGYREADAITTSYERLFEANADMIGWLNIPGTQIDYPVMQTLEDEEYYLRRNFYKEKAKTVVF